MSVSIHEMEKTISTFPDLGFGGGNTIDVTDVTDDLGMNLLANTKYMGNNNNNITFSTEAQGRSTNTHQIQPLPTSLQEVEFSSMEPLQPISIDTSFAPLGSVSVQKEGSSTSGVQFETFQSSSGPSINFSTPSTNSQNLNLNQFQEQIQPVDVEDEKKKKTELINKLQRLEKKGYQVSRRYTMDNSLEEMKTEYARLVDAKQLETSIRFQRNMLMGMCTGLEWMNNKFDPFDIKLDGWSESVHENVEDYDDIFEELYDKYKERGQMPPEARLVFQLASSGFMCHISNSFFRAKMPSAENVLKSNPELAKQFAQAAAAQASPAFGNFMNMAMGGQASQPQPQAQPNQRERAGVTMPNLQGFDPSMGPPGAFFQGARTGNVPQNIAAQNPPQVARREMSGPSGVDDILKTFEQVREAEASMSVLPPQLPPRSPSAAAVAEIQSQHSEDISIGQSERTSGGRRRKRAAPSGSMISLNV